MLTEVFCDKFIKDGKVRQPIVFHPGLNVVLGNNQGSNSIGKSTFLMILDFVFGGSDYVERCADVLKHVGEHTICFTFQFEGTNYHFCRSTNDSGRVFLCNSEYNPLEDQKPITLTAYCKFLQRKYYLSYDGLTWRNAVSRFIRVYKRDTLDEELPLKSAKKEAEAAAIKGYMLLFDRYAPVAELAKAVDNAITEEDAFRKSTMKFNRVRAAKNDKEYAKNLDEINRLEQEKVLLARKSNQGLLDLDSATASRIAELSEKLPHVNRELASQRTKLDSIKKERAGGTKNFTRSFSELERFFPAEDFKSLSEIEDFHRSLTRVLADEFAAVESSLEESCSYLQSEANELQSSLSEIDSTPNVSEAILQEYARLDGEIRALTEANENFDTLQTLKENITTNEISRDKVMNDELNAIEISINPEMKKLTNKFLGDEDHMPPILRFANSRSYTFTTPNDGGTGAQYRSLIAFDLATMAVTHLPFVVHDSVLLKNIERPVLSRIFEAYVSEKDEGKQVFMAYDSIDAYSDETQKLLRANEVLKLSPNGNELFGWSWNKETKEKGDKGK